MALEHFVLVVVRVLRGPSQADESAKKLRKLLHCQWCEARLFLKQGSMVDGGWSQGQSTHQNVRKAAQQKWPVTFALCSWAQGRRGSGSWRSCRNDEDVLFSLQTRFPARVTGACLGRRPCSWDPCGRRQTAPPMAADGNYSTCACVCRSGPLFNTGFLRQMLLAAVQHSMDDIQPLVKTLICESECTTLKTLVHGAPPLTNQGTDSQTGPSYVSGGSHTRVSLCSGVWGGHQDAAGWRRVS